MKQLKIKIIIFIILIGLLLLPLLQFSFKIIKEKDLDGDYTLNSKPDSVKYKWLSGSFQTQYDKYFEDHIGFRNSFIRFHNQLKFSLFNTVNRDVAIIGKENILYDERYITTTLGNDFIGGNMLERYSKDLRDISDKLKKGNKNILVVFAPNKARYYKKEIPDHYKVIDTTNYDLLISLFDKENIDYIDFNKLFLEKKSQVDYNLIPKYGIHWSNYSAYLVSDSIINYCNKKFNYNLPKYSIDSIIYTNVPKEPDYDLGKTLNLFKKIDDEIYLYPVKSVVKNDSTEKKRLLTISDSFFNNLYHSGFTSDIFDLSGYWYYNKKLMGQSRNKNEEDLEKTLPNTDLIIIMSTEWNLYRLGFGIIEQLKAYYNNNTTYSGEILQYKNRIMINKEWFDDVKRQAKERNISVDSMLVRAALYMKRQKDSANN